MKVGKKPVAVLIMMFKMRGARGRIYLSWMKKKMGGEKTGEGVVTFLKKELLKMINCQPEDIIIYNIISFFKPWK